MPEPHDFAVRSALTAAPIGEMPTEALAKALKRRSPAQRWVTHGRTRPATTIAPDAAASTASNPASVTIAIRPLLPGWMGEVIAMICPTAKAVYFFERDWTGGIRLIPFSKLA